MSIVDVSTVYAATTQTSTVSAAKMNTGTLVLYVGQKLNIKPLITASASKAGTKFISSKKNVVSVSSKGLLTAKKKGKAVITVKNKSGKRICKKTVSVVSKNNYKKLKKLSFAKSSYTLKKGKTLTPSIKFGPSNASNKHVKFTSSNKKVATVTYTGKIKAISAGTATITATATDGSKLKAKTTIKVPKNIKVSSIDLSHYYYLMEPGKTLQVSATVYPSNATNKKLEWVSDDTSVATVDQNGLITAVSEGYTYIIASATDGSGIYEEIEINVKNKFLQVYDNENDIELGDGDTIYLYENKPKTFYVYAFEQDADGLYDISSSAGESLEFEYDDYEQELTLKASSIADEETLTIAYGTLKKTFVLDVLKLMPINYVTNGGEELAPTSAYENSKLLLPIPFRDKYVFKGWFIDEELTQQITEDIKLEYREEGYTLYAAWEAEYLKIEVPEAEITAGEIDCGLYGTYTTNSDIDELFYTVINENEEEVSSGYAITGDGEWSIDTLGIVPGKNTIIFKAKTIGGVEDTANCIVTYDRGEIITEVEESDIVGLDDETGEEIQFIKNRIDIIFGDDVDEEYAKEYIEGIDGTIIGQLRTIDMYQVQLKRDFETYEEIIEYADSLVDEEIVLSVSPELIQVEENGVRYNDLNNSANGGNWWYDAINAWEAWSYASKMSKVQIGVVDGGFDVDHEDLKGKIHFTSNKREQENNAEDHGTHVAGIITANKNNGIGLAGLAWMNDIYAFDITKPNTKKHNDADTRILDACVEAIENHCKVVSISQGFSQFLHFYEHNYSKSYVKSQGRTASTAIGKLLEKGYDFVIVQSAGNGRNNILDISYGVDAINNGLFASITRDNCYKSSRVSAEDIMSRIFIVANAERNVKHDGTPLVSGHSTDDFVLTMDSNGGSQVNIAAPGQVIYSCIAGNNYDELSGTSMAAPIVSAVASMVWGINNSFTGKDVQNIVIQSCEYTAFDNPNSEYATGDFPMINAQFAIEEAIRRGGYVEGKFTDAETGEGIQAKYIIHKNSVDGEIVNGDGSNASSDGSFIERLPAGIYVFEISAVGYVTSYATVKVSVDSEITIEVSLTKNLNPNAYRIVLNWGSEPEDLDSHARAVSSAGSDVHVYYHNQNEEEMNLDHDDTDSFGPETITINNLKELSGLRYAVHNYTDRENGAYDSDALNLSKSGATVSVFKGNELLKTFTVPKNRKGTLWTVFSLSNTGVISSINSMSFESEASNVLATAAGSKAKKLSFDPPKDY